MVLFITRLLKMVRIFESVNEITQLKVQMINVLQFLLMPRFAFSLP